MTTPMVHFFVFLSIYGYNILIMKHLLNNISEEEKNRIREQHEGGMNLSIDNFKKLVETKSGDAKPFINEASEETCEQCGGMIKEGECVEQCDSMKEEVSEQSSNAKQVAGPFSKPGKGDVKFYIFQDGSKFYIYVTNVIDKEPTLSSDNDGKGYPNEYEAKKIIDNMIKSKRGNSYSPKFEPITEQDEDDVIRLIMDINTKLPNDIKSRMVVMKDFDEKQKVSFFERLMALAEKHFEK